MVSLLPGPAASIIAAVLTITLAIGASATAWIYRDQRDLITSQLKQIADDRDQIDRDLRRIQQAGWKKQRQSLPGHLHGIVRIVPGGKKAWPKNDGQDR